MTGLLAQVPPVSELLWWVFASMAVGGGLGMVTRKNPVAALLFLVLTFFSLAALYLLLGAHFIAAIQIIVYAGAILVLFLFVIMLLNLGHDYQADIRGGGWIVAGFASAGVIGYFLSRAFLGPQPMQVDAQAAAIEAAVAESNAVGAIALPLFRDHVVAFEIVGLLLLVAIVGAVLLAKRRI
jgi:NADH-quinone oxidoreductase subunit J